MLLILAADSEAGRAGGTIEGGGESESSLHRCLNATFVCAIRPGHEGMHYYIQYT